MKHFFPPRGLPIGTRICFKILGFTIEIPLGHSPRKRWRSELAPALPTGTQAELKGLLFGFLLGLVFYDRNERGFDAVRIDEHGMGCRSRQNIFPRGIRGLVFLGTLLLTEKRSDFLLGSSLDFSL